MINFTMANWRNLPIILLFTLIGSITSASIDKDCAKGVPYWCEHVMNAKKCSAVDFCIQAVWQTHDVKIDNNPLCDDCKNWVSQARDFIARDKTSEEVISSLELSCKICPDKDVQKKCEKLIDENVKEIFRLLESTMNPDAFCSAIHLCNNPTFTEMFAVKKSADERSLPFTCGQCNLIGSHLETKFKHLSHDEVLEGILSFCRETSSFSDSCMNIVLKNFDDINLRLHSKITRQNMCQITCSGLNQYSEEPTFTDDTVPCKLCEQLLLHLRELFIDNTSNVEFKNIVEGFCTQIPKITDECISITEQYSDEIYRFFTEGLNANKTCGIIGLCKSGKNLQTPAMPLLSDESFLPLLNPKGVIFDENSIILHGDGKWCIACEYAMNLIHEEMGKNTVEDKIVEYARKSCKTLPKYEKQCENIMDMFGDEIASLIYHGSDPRLACPVMKLCPPNLDLTSIGDDEKTSCPFCLFAMKQINDFIGSNKTKIRIQEALGKLCKNLSDKQKPKCLNFVKTNTEMIIDLVFASFTPQDSCVFMKMCNKKVPVAKRVSIAMSSSESFSSENTDDFPDSNSELVSNPQCELCKEIIQILEQKIVNIKSKDDARSKLESSCLLLKQFSKECKAFIDKYSDRIIDLLSQELQPERICRDLVFCVTSDQKELQDYDAGLDILQKAFEIDENSADSTSLESLQSNPGCVLCEFVIQKIEDNLNDKTTDEEIKKTVRNICSKMPSTIGKQCDQFVDYYFDMIVALIVTTPPDTVCEEMKLCPEKFAVSEIEFSLKEPNKDSTCVFCELVVKTLIRIVDENKTSEEMKKVIKNMCSIMPLLGKQCNKFTDQYFDMIIALIGTADPDKVCQELDLCPESLENKFQEIQNDIYSCAVCRGVVEGIDTIIEDPGVDDTLENLEEKICVKFSGRFKSKCRNIASTYGVAIINLLKNITESDQICFKFSLCPLNVGGASCT